MKGIYESPTKAIAPSVPLPFGWGRVLVFACLIYAAAMAVGLSSGLSMGHWEIYGSTMQVAMENARLVRRIAYGTVGAFFYWRLAAPVQHRLRHVAAAFVIVQLIDWLVSILLFQVPVRELLDAWALGRSAVAAVVGLSLASLGARTSSKSPEPA